MASLTVDNRHFSKSRQGIFTFLYILYNNIIINVIDLLIYFCSIILAVSLDFDWE